MLPAWCYFLFGLLFAALGFAAWKVWYVQIRIWLIPAGDIRKDAEGLIRRHGTANAHGAALSLCLQAWRRDDAIGAGRWDRVMRWLQCNARNDTNGLPPDVNI